MPNYVDPEQEINPEPEETQQESREDYILDRDGDCDYKGDSYE